VLPHHFLLCSGGDAGKCCRITSCCAQVGMQASAVALFAYAFGRKALKVSDHAFKQKKDLIP
jgi:hypothetical protein